MQKNSDEKKPAYAGGFQAGSGAFVEARFLMLLILGRLDSMLRKLETSGSIAGSQEHHEFHVGVCTALGWAIEVDAILFPDHQGSQIRQSETLHFDSRQRRSDTSL